ncbi:MAG: hypothetical protein F9K16_12955 [Thermoanaerobaculia bacterium]|jgi:hypothetical protein|nr:MAG: hypothetical protein F9K16_12955 [Thermoanaerobaculia bacterium]MBZ0102866.1 hypothetical protein [Thermoanaerobaculia bacterium]
MNARKMFLLSAAIVAGLLPLGCDTNEAKLPSQPRVQPVEPEVVPIVTVTTSRGRLWVGDDRFAMIKVTATDPRTGASVPNLTIAEMSTNLGNFQSMAGLQELELEFFWGEVNVPLFPGAEAGDARVRAEVDGGVGVVTVRMTCPEEGCAAPEPPETPYS